LASHFLHEGIEHGESSIYVSFSESKDQFYNNVERIGMNFKKFENDDGAFTFLDFTSVNKDGIQDALDEVLSVVRETKAKRIVVDSFSAIAQAFESQNDARIALQVILGKIIRAQGVTSMLIAEVPVSQQGVGSGIEEFVVDGIIKLEHGGSNASPMTLQVAKMRGTEMDREPHVVTIGPTGMILYTKYPMKLQYHSSQERLSSGIDGLDEKMEGGMLKGSTTALVGASGVGKTTLGFQFVAEGVKRGQSGIFCSLEESPDQIALMASKFGYDIDELQRNGLTLISKVAEEQSLDAFISYLSNLIVEKKPVRLVIDSISSFVHTTEKEMYTLTKRLVNLAHDNQITIMFAILTQQESGFKLTTIGTSSLFDNIIVLPICGSRGQDEAIYDAVQDEPQHTMNRFLNSQYLQREGLRYLARWIAT
jgi:circadian clock protein KaiC